MAVINPPLHDVSMDYDDSEQIVYLDGNGVSDDDINDDEEILTIKKQKCDIEAGVEKEPYKTQVVKHLHLPDP